MVVVVALLFEGGIVVVVDGILLLVHDLIHRCRDMIYRRWCV